MAGVCKSIQVRSNMNGHYMLHHACQGKVCIKESDIFLDAERGLPVVKGEHGHSGASENETVAVMRRRLR